MIASLQHDFTSGHSWLINLYVGYVSENHEGDRPVDAILVDFSERVKHQRLLIAKLDTWYNISTWLDEVLVRSEKVKSSIRGWSSFSFLLSFILGPCLFIILCS